MPYHVLLVDDDRYFRSEFSEFMTDFDVIEADNGRKALEILKKPHNIDLVILDEHMPETKGTELLERVHRVSPGTRTIILTGHGSKDVAVNALRGQAAEYVEKPLTPDKIDKIRGLILSAPHGEKDRHSSGIKGKIEQAKYFAERNYDKKLTLNDVADEVCLSPKYLSRVFKKETGRSFLEYKLQLRMDRAKEMLKNSGDNIEEISIKLGYQNPESFCKVFRKFTNMTPRSYRAQIEERKDRKAKSSRVLPSDKKSRARLKTVSPSKRQRKTLEHDKSYSSFARTIPLIVHKMRNPVNSIQVAAWNIKKKIGAPSIAGNLACIEEMVAESERVIDRLLHYTLVRPPARESVPVKRLITECINNTQKRFAHKKAAVKTNLNRLERKRVTVDPEQLKVAVSEVLINAFESLADTKKGRITVHAQIKDDHLSITIKDNGKGIVKADKAKIFKPSFSRKHNGLGLGLTFCEHLIKIHNGPIDVDSTFLKGTKVTIRIPLRYTP